jgi:hypothetical protein
MHNGFGRPCKRKFEITCDSFTVEDWFDGEAVSYVHLAKGVDENRVIVRDSLSVEVKPCKYSVEYNKFIIGKLLEIKFKNHLSYTIR